MLNRGFVINTESNPFFDAGGSVALELQKNATTKNRLKCIMTCTKIPNNGNEWITSNSMWNELIRQVLETAYSYKVI